MKFPLCICLAVLMPSVVFAAWASFLVVTPDGIEGKGIRPANIPIPSVRTTTNGVIEVRIKDPRLGNGKNFGKVYQLVRTREPLDDPSKLRQALSTWKIYEGDLARMQSARENTLRAIKEQWPEEKRAQLDEKERKLMEGSIKGWKSSAENTLVAMKINKHEVLVPANDADQIVLRIPKAAEKTTYLYYGFHPGSFVMDGGERVTYDLPAFVAKHRR